MFGVDTDVGGNATWVFEPPYRARGPAMIEVIKTRVPTPARLRNPEALLMV